MIEIEEEDLARLRHELALVHECARETIDRYKSDLAESRNDAEAYKEMKDEWKAECAEAIKDMEFYKELSLKW